MMILAMVIIGGLVGGGGGLGWRHCRGLTRGDPGRGVEAGISIVLMAMVLDRVTTALAQRPHT